MEVSSDCANAKADFYPWWSGGRHGRGILTALALEEPPLKLGSALRVGRAPRVPASSAAANRTQPALYADSTFAKDGLSLSDGTNTFSAVGQDILGRADTNAATVYLPATLTFAYDDNGNLLSDGRRAFGYDDENQLITITVTNAWHSRFVYDGLGRRRVRMEASWVNSAWVTNAVIRYVYDGMLVIQERDGNNVPLVTYTRGRDLSGGMQGAGGIGGLLARTENGKLITGNASAAHAYFHADALGNVTCLIDANESVVARYHYDPYGNVLAKSGSLADANLYRFSSKEAHAAWGLVYYRFRYYDPSVQRWINRDPIGEEGGINIYESFANGPLNLVDPWGLMLDGKWNWPSDKGLYCRSSGGLELELNPVEAVVRLYREADACGERVFRQVRTMSGEAGHDDKWEHCVASCRIARECASGGLFGAMASWVAGDVCRDPFWSKNDLDSIGDRAANEVGRSFRERKGRYEDLCSEAQRSGPLILKSSPLVPGGFPDLM